MILGVVGHAADKFTPETEALARRAILAALARHRPSAVVSGGCHLGGVDIWAEQLARALGIPVTVHAPRVHAWAAPGGYRDRNLKIAREADRVLCVAVRDYPPGYAGMRFPACYHCRGRNPCHVKGGGCWTAWQARAREWVFLPLPDPGDPGDAAHGPELLGV